MVLRLRQILPLIGLFALVALLDGALRTTTQAGSLHAFRLAILRQRGDALHLGDSAATAWPKLKQADRHEPLIAIDDGDIESYDWHAQTLVLTVAATDRFLSSLATVDPRAAIKKQDPLLALRQAFAERVFVATLDDAVLYGGIVLDAMSRKMAAYPVMRLEILGGRIVLHLLPQHIVLVQSDPPEEAARWDAAIAPEAADNWAALGDDAQRLHLRNAFTAEAKALRQILRDERVRSLMEAQDKLVSIKPLQIAAPATAASTTR
jgi:hypothetical protein